jgi:glycosyltransferase involved in cell wall biosynthesis
LKALLELHNRGITIPLVLTGAQFSAASQIFDFVKENKMHYVYYLGKVPFDDLVALYQASRFMITAVLYESSSLPILEAAAAGTPIIASNTQPNVELNEKLRINLFDPTSVDDLIKLLENIWENHALIEEQKATNLKNIEFYSWKNIAAKYLVYFEKIIQTQNQKKQI